MVSFFTFHRSSAPIEARSVVAACFLGVGWIGYTIIQFAFNSIDYATPFFFQVMIYEWLPVAKPIFLSFVPVIFLDLVEIFQQTSWKRIVLIAIVVGIILTIPGYQYNLRRWMPLVRTIQGLPIKVLGYSRHTGSLGSPAGMGIVFVTSKESFPQVKETFETQLAANKNMLLLYSLEDARPLSASYLVDEISEGDKKITLYVYPLYQGYDY